MNDVQFFQTKMGRQYYECHRTPYPRPKATDSFPHLTT